MKRAKPRRTHCWERERCLRECGIRSADCGLRNDFNLSLMNSEIRISCLPLPTGRQGQAGEIRMGYSFSFKSL